MKIIKFALLTALLMVSINILNPIVSAKPKVSLAAARKSRSVDEVKTGVIKWFNPKKGFGFITRDDGGKDVVAMAKDIQISGIESGYIAISEGLKVIFTLYEDAKGPKSKNIIPR